MSAENWDAFGSVEMYRSYSDPSVNFEYLFTLQDPETGGDPGPGSLFNLTTLQELVSLGQSTTNVIYNKTLTYGVDFNLDDWAGLATTMGLDDLTGADPSLGSKRAYLIWLWMQTLWDLTFERV